MNRTHKISFRVSDYEHKLVQSKVKQSGIRMSDFCRHAVLGKKIRTVKGLDKCSYELNKIGNNLNQLTVLCHQMTTDVSRMMASRVVCECADIQKPSLDSPISPCARSPTPCTIRSRKDCGN